MLDYTIPVLQFIVREGSSQLELYESGEGLTYNGNPADRRSFIEHQAIMGSQDDCRIVAYPPDGMAATPADEWVTLWFRNGTLMGDVRVSLLKAFENQEEAKPNLVLERLTFGGWSIEELVADEPDDNSAEELDGELQRYCDETCSQPEWANDIMDSTDELMNDIITDWQRTQVIDPSLLTNDERISEPGIYYVIDSDETRLPAGGAIQLTAAPGVTLCCHTQHNILVESGSSVFVYGPTSVLMRKGSAAYVAGGRSVTTVGKCDLMVLRDARQIHCFGEKPNFVEVGSIVL